MLDGISWSSVLAQALQTGGALLMVIVAWTLPRAVWRGALWWFNSGGDRSEAERAALTKLLNEAEERGYSRGWCAAAEALNDKVAPASATISDLAGMAASPRLPITSADQIAAGHDVRS